MRERKRRHDDVHYPLQGRGRKATPRKAPASVLPKCEDCGRFPAGSTHLCTDHLRKPKSPSGQTRSNDGQ